MKVLGKFARNTFLILLISVLLLELFGVFIGNNEYFWSNRQILIPPTASRSIGLEGLWIYQPKINVDSSATYYFSNRNGWLEYRCKFDTNQFGLIKTNYRGGKNVDLLVLGDSFLEGQGGCAWLTEEKLQQKNVSKIVLNGGLQGASLQSMKLLNDWLERKVKIKDLRLIVISNDFRRQLDYPSIKLTQQKMSKFYPAKIVDLKDEDLLEIGGNLYRSGEKDFRTKLRENFLYYSLSYRLFYRLSRAFSDDQKNDQNYLKSFEKNFVALRELRKKYPRLKIILVPQRDEVGLLGSKNRDTKIVEKFFADEGFDFSRCELDLSDYMKVDGHPNKEGYAKISRCFFDQNGDL